MKERFEIPDEQCERLTRSEMGAVQMLLASVSHLRYASEDLQRRLGSVPDGVRRMSETVEQASDLLADILGTVSDRQRSHLRGVANDMEIRLVPKLAGKKTTLMLTEAEGKELVDAAQARCADCMKDDTECQQCRLFRILETVVPLETYTGFLCPYSKAEWEDK